MLIGDPLGDGGGLETVEVWILIQGEVMVGSCGSLGVGSESRLFKIWWSGNLGLDGTGLTFEARFQEFAQLALVAFKDGAGGF